MSPRIYADTVAYLTYTEIDHLEAGEEVRVQRRLRRASALVDDLLLAAVYDVDGDGMPTNPVVAEAMSDAVCAQAEWFEETGDDTGAAEQFAGGSLGSLSLSRPPGVSRYAPDTVAILRRVGLLQMRVNH